MRALSLLLWISIPFVSSIFVSPSDKFEGMTKLSEHENSIINEMCGTQAGVNKMNHGTIAKKGQFPWAVAIESRYYNRFCTGTIISQRHVLTAAHCVIKHEYLDALNCQKKSIESESEEIYDDIVGGYVAYGGTCNYAAPNDKFNVSGSPCEKDDMTRVLISAVTWEKRYRDRIEAERCTNFDVAIIEVARDFHWSKFARPVCLSLNYCDYHDMIATFYGFGVVNFTTPLDEKAKYEYFPDLRYGSGKAIRRNDTWIVVAPKSIERATDREQTSPFAQIESGDSGGGIVVNWGSRSILVGIATEALENDFKSRGAEIYHHINEICELTGVCPIDQCS